MRFVLLSDTHGLHDQINVPEGDVLIHAGDFCNYGTPKEVAAFARWLASLPHPAKIVVAGNHDWPFDPVKGMLEAAAQILRDAGAHYLYDRDLTLDAHGEPLVVYGSPWQPEFCNWAFNLPRGSASLKRKWDRIPESTDILITHGPPFGHRDVNPHGEPCGCELLAERVEQLRPRLHVFGHIHSGYGVTETDATTFVNAASCTEQYRPTNPPVVLNYVDGAFAVSNAVDTPGETAPVFRF